MELITQIPIARADKPIGYDSKILSIGSCFAVNMAEKFGYFQFRHKPNPFGILFHPLAIEKFLEMAVQQKTFTDADVFFHNERWHCFDAHSDLSATDKETLLAHLNNATAATKSFLPDATHTVITLGTAWVYRENASGNLVANCHKMPQRGFSKELLAVDTIAQSLQNSIDWLQKSNPNIRIILTVSPVRHIKDGFLGNQRSKAHLIAALCQVLENRSDDGRVNYFPSYEIMMDELRDYRFYAQDLLHPSPMAIDYIWERFASAWVSADAFKVMAQVDGIRKSLAHRSFHPESESHRAFQKSVVEKMDKLRQQFPFMEF